MASGNIDIIYPPSHIRSIIDKTAQFVAKNGEQFEARIRNEQGDSYAAGASKFAFLNPANAYNGYYKLRLNELKNGVVVDSRPAIPQAILDKRKKLELKNKSKETLLALSDFHSTSSANEEPVAPAEDVFSFLQPYISSLDMDIIKTTALFIARNGQKFLNELNKRERNNPQFDFLNPSHHLFGLLTSLIESYAKCLIPPKAQITKLNEIARDRTRYLIVCQQRADWDAKEAAKLESELARKAAEKAELESIDWHNFFIAETIPLDSFNDKLPGPIDFSKPGVIAILRSGRPMRPATEAEQDSKTVEETLSNLNVDEALETPIFVDETPAVEVPEEQPPKFSEPAAPTTKRKSTRECDTKIVQDGDEVIKVKKSYTRKSKAASSQSMQKCPITGQLVPADQMTNHLQILLMDPQWKKQKDKFMAKAIKESAFAPTDDIEKNLASFVAGRPDLFGSIEDADF